jgi:hypothetical protein
MCSTLRSSLVVLLVSSLSTGGFALTPSPAPTTVAPTPKPGSKPFNSLDVTVTDPRSGNVVSLHRDPSSTAAKCLMKGGVQTQVQPPGGALIDLSLTVPASETHKVRVIETSPGNVTLKGIHGEHTGISLTYTSAPGPGPKDVTYKGILTANGRRFEYSATTDPGPLVIIVVVLVLASLCEVIIKVNDCANAAAILASIDACKSHGRPKVTINTTFGIKFNPFKIGCHNECEFECLPLGG